MSAFYYGCIIFFGLDCVFYLNLNIHINNCLYVYNILETEYLLGDLFFFFLNNVISL